MAPAKKPKSPDNAAGLQLQSCAKRPLRGAQALPTMCCVCSKQLPACGNDVCRFLQFRIITATGTTEFLTARDSDRTPDIYPTVFNIAFCSAIFREFQHNLARCVQPVLEEMKRHEGLDGLIRKAAETTHRVLCDCCSTFIFSSSFLCNQCGFEICPTCSQAGPQECWPLCDTRHELHIFLPLSRLSQDEVAQADNYVQSVLAGGTPPERHVPDWAKAKKVVAEFSYTAPRISSGQEDGFRFLWSHNIPVIVERAGSKLKGRWTPEAFVKFCPGDEVSMIRCGLSPARTERVTVESFFAEFRRASRSREDVVKVKDWPPLAEFSEKFLEYFLDFMDSVPMPAYTRDNGILNLAAHYPKSRRSFKSFKPDLGPKMYVATRDLYNQGSTALHVDVTSAVNLLAHVEPDDVEEPGEVGAVWHIFRAVDAPQIRAYLCRKGHLSDPIHAQDTYLTEVMLSELASEGVRPWRICQAQGEAIFIPAGCPHQVSNRRACVKIACDFLCVEGVAASRAVSREFQAIRREDVLQLDAMLWHSWWSMSQLLESGSEDGASQDPGPSRRQKKRKASRETSNAKADNIRKKRQRKAESNPGLYNPGSFCYWCPHPSCAESKRPPFDFNGVLCHLRGRHEMVIDQRWKALSPLSPDEFAAEFKANFS